MGRVRRRSDRAKPSIGDQAPHIWSMVIYGQECRRGRPLRVSARRGWEGTVARGGEARRGRGGGGWRGSGSRPPPGAAPASGDGGTARDELGHLWSDRLGGLAAGLPETPMTSRSAGLRIALAAIAVQAPRLVLVVLGADRMPVPAPAERALLVLAGVGTALVLTGGNLYLAHTVAQVRPWRRTLAAAWVLVLAAAGGLVLPLIVAGISARRVPQGIGFGRLQWAGGA